MIIPVWKKVGQSTHLLAKEIGEKTASTTGNISNSKATHTGTLDPMAEGVIIVLTAEDRYRKAEFSDNKKVYEFEVLFGISTDSHDLLGMTEQIEIEQISKIDLVKKLGKILDNATGLQKQKQPKFSAQRVGGKSGFDLAKSGQNFYQQNNQIHIYSITIMTVSEINTADLQKKIVEKINLVTGDFRQNEIKNQWHTTLEKLQRAGVQNLPIIKIKIIASKRTYVRALVRDISEKINIPATTFSIIRTKNGIYSKKDTIQIQQ